MAILGDMRELGEVSVAEHQKIVDMLESSGIQTVWLVGEEFGKTQTSFTVFPNVEAVEEAISAQHLEHRCILIKGSNGVGLYRLPALL